MTTTTIPAPVSTADAPAPVRAAKHIRRPLAAAVAAVVAVLVTASAVSIVGDDDSTRPAVRTSDSTSTGVRHGSADAAERWTLDKRSTVAEPVPFGSADSAERRIEARAAGEGGSSKP